MKNDKFNVKQTRLSSEICFDYGCFVRVEKSRRVTKMRSFFCDQDKSRFFESSLKIYVVQAIKNLF